MARMRSLFFEPNSEAKSSWTAAGGAATDLAAVQKGRGTVAAPSTTTYIESTTNAQAEVFGFPNFSPADDEYVSFVRVHVYATTQALHTIAVTPQYSVSGTSYAVAGAPDTTIPVSSAAGWFHSPKLSPRRDGAIHNGALLTAADLDSLMVALTLTESSAQAATSKVYAVVLEVGLSTMEHLVHRDQVMFGPVIAAEAGLFGAHTGERFFSWGYQWGDTAADYASAGNVSLQFQLMRRDLANTVRIHVPFGGSGTGSSGYMTNATTPNESRFAEFERLLDIAEGLGMRVIVTGLNLYIPADRPSFLGALNEAARWATFGVFWNRLAQSCAGSPAVIALDLINEINLSGDPNTTDTDAYYAGNLGGKFYFALLSIKWNGRTIDDIVDDWWDIMEAAIRTWEPVRPIGVGGAFPHDPLSQPNVRSEILLPHIYTSTPQSTGLAYLSDYYDTGKPVLNEESGSTGSVAAAANAAFFLASLPYLVGINTNWVEGGMDGDPSAFGSILILATNVAAFLAVSGEALGSELERLTIDGLALHDTDLRLEALDLDPPPKRYQRQQAHNGSLIAEVPGREDRTVRLRLRATPGQQSIDRSFNVIGKLRDKLEEADRLVTEGQKGLPAVWVPAGSARPMTLYITGGDIESVPKVVQGDDAGYFANAQPVFNVTLTCNPFLYGETVTLLPSSAAGPLAQMTIGDVLGDVPAEATLQVKDQAGQDRRHVEWGLQQRNYNLSALVLDSDSVTVTGYSGTATTRTGAYDPGASGNSVVRATPTATSITICGMSAQVHKGRFRVRARFFGTGSLADGITMRVRLRWRIQGGPWKPEPWVDIPVYGLWCEPELASVALLPSWDWEIDCLGVGGSTATLDFDFLTLLPVDEGFGRASAASPRTTPAVLAAQDDFNTLTAGTSINGRAAPVGGTWATSTTGGSPADFIGTTPASGIVQKAGTSEGVFIRRALIPTARSAVEVGMLIWGQRWVESGGATNLARRGVVARFVDSSNYLLIGSGVGGPPGLYLIAHAGGAATVYGSTLAPVPAATWISFRMIVFDSGVVYWEVRPATISSSGVVTRMALLWSGAALISDCATGGALASGTCGFEAFNGSASANLSLFDNFYVSATPTPDAPVVPSGGRARFGSTQRSRAEREASPNAWSQVPYRGARFWLPASGGPGYNTRLAWRAARHDLDAAESTGLEDLAEAKVTYTPRYVDVPRV